MLEDKRKQMDYLLHEENINFKAWNSLSSMEYYLNDLQHDRKLLKTAHHLFEQDRLIKSAQNRILFLKRR